MHCLFTVFVVETRLDKSIHRPPLGVCARVPKHHLTSFNFFGWTYLARFMGRVYILTQMFGKSHSHRLYHNPIYIPCMQNLRPEWGLLHPAMAEHGSLCYSMPMFIYASNLPQNALIYIQTVPAVNATMLVKPLHGSSAVCTKDGLVILYSRRFPPKVTLGQFWFQPVRTGHRWQFGKSSPQAYEQKST